MKINFGKVIFVTLLLIGLNNSSTGQVWNKSFTAGSFDSNSNFLGGSEVLQLIGHKGKLFASVGYWEDKNNIWYGGNSSSIGWGQIIRLDDPTGQWQEDLFLGASYLRPEILKQVIFTKDAIGNLLPTPDTILIAAGYSPNFITNTVTVKSFTRNDNNGNWGESQIIQGSLPAGENYSIRDIETYIDQVTGIERVYASIGRQGLYAGKYNQSTMGKIDWIPTPEIGPLSIRPLGIANANNTLYFSSGNKLYRRNDGADPTYTIAHEFSDLSTNINSAVGGIRGLTTIKNPSGNDEALLLMWCPDGQSQGVIYHLEPDGAGGFNRIYETKLSLLVKDYLLGTNVNYLLGAYNEFYEFVDPVTNDPVHLIGFEANITGGGHPTWNSYYSGGLFAKREENMQYSIEEINGSIEATDTALVATRCYVKSPFANEDAIYFGGFDPNSNTATNMAWIYNRNYQTISANKNASSKTNYKAYPNPFDDQLILEADFTSVKEFEIYTIHGELMITGQLNSDVNKIDLSSLPSNIYLVKIENQLLKVMKVE